MIKLAIMGAQRQVVDRVLEMSGKREHRWDRGREYLWAYIILPFNYVGVIVHVISGEYGKALLSATISTIVLSLLFRYFRPMRTQFAPTWYRLRYWRGVRVRVAVPNDRITFNLSGFGSTELADFLREQTGAGYVEAGDIFVELDSSMETYNLATLWFPNVAAAVEFRLTNDDDAILPMSDES